jgi:hypothetical protein
MWAVNLGDKTMNPIRYRSVRLTPFAALFALSMLGAGQAAAAPATYNLILKQGGTPLTCARGAFVFDKAAVLQAGNTSGTTSTAEVTIDAGCFTKTAGRPPVTAPWPAQQLTLTGTLTIHLVGLTSKQEQPVLSVYGVTGTLASGNNVIQFSHNAIDPKRTARVCDAPLCPTGSSITVLTYHAVNVNSIPEPETLALVLMGALGLGFARWRGQRRS